MRKVDTRNFRLATRSTPREINRQIVLNLIREHQPISRAELARRMEVHRSHLTPLVRELVSTGTVYEEGTAPVVRGRRPTLLYVRTSGRLAAAVDVRPEHTTVALVDFAGHTLARDVFATPASPDAFGDKLADRIATLVDAYDARVAAELPNGAAPKGVAPKGAAPNGKPSACHGVGLVVPGMVDRRTGRILYAPRLGWRDVDLRGPLRARLKLPVYVEGAPVACALARLWLSPEETGIVRNFAYVSVSDGVGVGLVFNGDALRGESHTAGEFGHVTIDPHGPACVCGKRGCWESFACNSTTIARYADRVLRRPSHDAGDGLATPRPTHAATVEEIVRRGLRGEPEAESALRETGWYIGRGIAAVISAFNPGRIYVGGEITAAWELLEGPIRQALREETLTAAARATPVLPDRRPAEYRLLGAVALVAAPTYAVPRVG